MGICSVIPIVLNLIVILMLISFLLGCPGGTMVLLSLHNQKIVGSSPGGVLVLRGHSLSVTITELSEAIVCGALQSVGHCT